MMMAEEESVGAAAPPLQGVQAGASRRSESTLPSAPARAGRKVGTRVRLPPEAAPFRFLPLRVYATCAVKLNDQNTWGQNKRGINRQGEWRREGAVASSLCGTGAAKWQKPADGFFEKWQELGAPSAP